MIKVGVLGVGPISEQHLKYLTSAHAKQLGVELVGVCDLIPAARNYAAQQASCAAYDSLDGMLAAANPDVVHVLTPAHTHVPLVTQCLTSGVNVVCEKPLAPTAPEAQKLVSLAEEHGLQLTESHNYRFNNDVAQLIETIKEGELGELCEVEVRMALDVTNSRFADQNLPNPIHEMPAAVIHDFITHLTYLLTAVTGTSDFEVKDASWRNIAGAAGFRFDNLDAQLFAPDEAVLGRLRFDSRTYPDEFTITVRGTKAQAATNIFSPGVVVNKTRLGKQLSPLLHSVSTGVKATGQSAKDLVNKVRQITPYHGMTAMLEATYEALVAGKPLPVSGEDIVSTAKLIDDMVSFQSEGSRQ